MNRSIISLKNVSKLYHTKIDEIFAVKDINLNIEKGEFISLVGPSGCGKSTILSLISGLFPPTKGKIYIDGQEVTGPTRKIGYMLQQDYLLNWRTVEENILLGLEIQKRLTTKNRNQALHLLEEMGLTSYKDSHPNQLSGGMRQRVALVRTLATNPDILLLDEPFSALDYQTRLKLEDLVVETIHKHEKTAILVTHDISEAIAMSDRIVLLGKNPGHIKKVFNVPDPIRNSLPLKARNVPEFQNYFHLIWSEIEDDE
ncbi:spermidine/putrescine ABC transporter ATP-binding protein [Vulcanibacillus modesticaldus]|uniref:Spermidine/putrescine ABC transporter ATP-binding protein n=1 Tax=Vulcanibacillus modesticaldus TaxID=337097 RepID=A0A1D2YSX2_9BACI|nr:ABC transporter ATP-binding protein [Vulcanibacillus modesticaldus]OEF98079.1 spermidine/putrescine ABC transporter ATP-binding protein [Vulcanibacillus modesticaldus]